MKEKHDKIKENPFTEDATECGEFICSYFSWLTLDQQKKKAEELDKMTKKCNNIDEST